MSLVMVLDYWEKRVTKRPKRWETKEPSRFDLWCCPEFFQPVEDYRLRLYLVRTTISGVIVVLLVLLTMFAPVAYFVHLYPQILHNPRYHKFLISLLSDLGIYWLPCYILLLLVFNYAINLPRFYFWNRRAKRLRSEVKLMPELSGRMNVPDPSVWPPPPVRPGGSQLVAGWVPKAQRITSSVIYYWADDFRSVVLTHQEATMSDLVTVGSYFDRMEAEIAKSVLDINEIQSYISADDGGGMRPSLLTATGGARLIVRAEEAVRATEVLQAAMQSEDGAE